MDEEVEKNLTKVVLKNIIDISSANFSAEDVVREFRPGKGEKPTSRKLLKILEIISKNHQRAAEALKEAAINLKTKDPYVCLLLFLTYFSSSDMKITRKIEMPTSTPILLKKITEMVAEGTYKDIVNENVTTATTTAKATATVTTLTTTAAATTTTTLITEMVTTTSTTTTSANIFDSNKLISAGYTKKIVYPIMQKSSTQSFWDYCVVECQPPVPFANVEAIPLTSQETVLLYDLLYCLSGVRSSLIVPTTTATINIEGSGEINCIKFKITDVIQKSLRDIAQEILQLVTYYHCVHQFIDNSTTTERGQVLEALANAFNDLLEDYYILLTQLENELTDGLLTVHKLYFYLRPTINTMEIFAGAINSICSKNARGGKALTILVEQIDMLTGNETAQKFMIELTEKAAIPYMDILKLWIYKGIIEDPFDEFLVEDNESIQRCEQTDHYSADYWEKRYTIRHVCCPIFLHSTSNIILRTGKYLNVIRQCGKKVIFPKTVDLQFIAKSQDHITHIEAAYRFASQTLLELLLKGNALMGHLMSVKRYLLLQQGDFIMQFMDACEDELSKNLDQVLPMKLENLLGLTLRLSAANQDPYKEDLHCELLTYDLVTQMSKIISDNQDFWENPNRIDLSGLECFAFRYEVKWPISLVLNHIAISKYQMLFRQLFYCKHIERQLCKIWKENSSAKKFAPQAAELYRSAFTLRQRMMNAIQNIEYYMMIEVIEPSWHTFLTKMNKVANVDQVLEYHQDFLDSCLKNCMLSDAKTLHRAIFKLCKICLKFCEFIQLESTLAPADTFSERVKCFDLEFTGILIGLLKHINDLARENPADRFINLVHRINFNCFYDLPLEKLCIDKLKKKQCKNNKSTIE